MPLQYKIIAAQVPMIFIATESQSTLQAPLTEARKVSAVAAGFGYECLTFFDDGTRQWAALATNTAGLFAEWVIVKDATKPLESPTGKGYILRKRDLSDA